MTPSEQSTAPTEGGEPSTPNYLQDFFSILALIDRAQANLQAANWQGAPTSGAAKDERWFAANRPECGQRAADMVSDALTILLRNAVSHLNGFAILYRNREHFLAPGVLARALLENISYTFWVIGRSDDDPLNRMARAYLEEFASAEQALKAARSFSGPKAAEVRAAKKAELDELIAEAAELLGEVTQDKEGAYILRGERRPGPTGVVSKMYKLWRERNVTTQSDKEVAGIYGYLSSCTHPTLYPARELIREQDGVQFEQTDLDFLYRQASVVLDAFTQGLCYVYSYSGVEMTGVLEIRQDMAALRPAVAH